MVTDRQVKRLWRDEFLAGGEAALGSGQGGADGRDRQIEELKREVARRDQVIGELTIANRIPKKTSESQLWVPHCVRRFTRWSSKSPRPG